VLVAGSANHSLALPMESGSHRGDIAGAVAAMTEGELDVLSEELPTTCLVNRDSAPRRARRFAVEFE
jgi:hypothetical protein